MLKTKIPIGIKKVNYADVSRTEFDKVYARYKKDPVAFVTGQMAASGADITIQKEDGTPMRSNDLPAKPYNPIER